MSFLDAIPTLPEVMDFTACRLIGHLWENGSCQRCGKERK